MSPLGDTGTFVRSMHNSAFRTWTKAAIACLLLASCAKSPPTAPLAGGKSIDHWIEALRAPDAKLRREAVEKLGNVGSSSSEATAALIGSLHDKDPHVRCDAILALAKSTGAARESALGPLTELLTHDPDAKVHYYAAKGLKRLKESG